MSIVLVVENVVLPVSAALTCGDGDAFVSAPQVGVPETAGPPAFTRYVTVWAEARGAEARIAAIVAREVSVAAKIRMRGARRPARRAGRAAHASKLDKSLGSPHAASSTRATMLPLA